MTGREDLRHPGLDPGSRNTAVRGVGRRCSWIPTFAGMTGPRVVLLESFGSFVVSASLGKEIFGAAAWEQAEICVAQGAAAGELGLVGRAAARLHDRFLLLGEGAP